MAHAHTRSVYVSGVLILLLAFLTAIDSIAIDLYLPGIIEIERDLNLAEGKAQQTISVFLLGMAVGQGIYGPLLDRFGRRPPLLVGFVIFSVGSLLASFTPNFEWLLLARFLQSLGAAAGLVAPRAITADICSLSEASRVFSLLMQVMMVSPIVAPILGGFLLSFVGWRVLFDLMFLLGVLGFVWVYFCLPETLDPRRRLPLRLKTVLRSYFLFFFHKRFMALVFANCCCAASVFFFIGYSAVIFQSFFKLSPAQYSYLFAANGVLTVAAGALSNVLLARGFKEKQLLFAGIALNVFWAVIALIVALLAEKPNFWLFALPTILSTGSLALAYGSITALTMFEVKRRVGTASALLGVAQYLFAAIVGGAASFFTPQIVYLPLVIILCGIGALALCFVKK